MKRLGAIGIMLLAIAILGPVFTPQPVYSSSSDVVGGGSCFPCNRYGDIFIFCEDYTGCTPDIFTMCTGGPPYDGVCVLESLTCQGGVICEIKRYSHCD